MFFFLSKTISYLVMPVTLITIAFLLSVFIRRPGLKKVFFWTGLSLFLFFSNDFMANEAMRAWELEPVAFEKLEPHKLGIVLTGATIPYMEPNDRVYFNKGADRVTHTVQLYKLGLIKRILISGGTGQLIPDSEAEANKFQKVMVMMGVDSADIILENETRNTYESAVAVRAMLDSIGISATDCLLITSAFHMRRSLACYAKAGLDIKPFTTDFYSHQRNFYLDTLLLPKVDAIGIWHKLFKEWIGLAAYKVAGYV